MKKPNTYSIDRLRQVFVYDDKRGLLIWKERTARKIQIGQEAGTVARGRLYVTVENTKLNVARVIWALHYGSWPKHFIDHIDGNPLNNKVSNLRDVPHWVNSENVRQAKAHNQSGVLGVRASKSGRKWEARIRVRGKEMHLGVFSTADAAHQAYVRAKRELHEGNTL